jgi:hypothetical protein
LDFFKIGKNELVFIAAATDDKRSNKFSRNTQGTIYF